ncbi:MAG: beta-ketoacyl-ACP synthase III [Rectinemataceae bacterium]
MTNDELGAMVDTNDAWIREHTGIGARHIAADGMLTSDLAADAAKKALAKAGISPKELDFILVATATPDYFGFPSTACIVQDKIGAHGCGAFDIAAGCTGFIYGLDIASGMLEARKGRHALVIGAEILSRVTDWSDRATCVLFGDGAGAVVLSRIEESGRGVLKTILGADGGGAKDLVLNQPERSRTFEVASVAGRSLTLSMNGRNVYTFAVKSITVLVERILHSTMYRLEDFAWIVPHQANARIVQAAAKRLGIPETRFYMNMEEYANTSAASIPLALAEMEEKGILKRGDLIMMLGFGAGLTYGASVVRW